MNKVVVTGMGAITSLGNNTEEYWNSLVDGKCGIKNITRISVDTHETTVAGEVDDGFETLARKYWTKRQLSSTTKGARIALASAGEAIDNSKIDFEKVDRSRIGVIYGIAHNSFYDAELEKPLNMVLKDMPSLVPSLISMKYDLHGAAFNLSSACASSGYAITVAAQMIEAGIYDAVIVGGLSNVVSHFTLKEFNQVLAMSTNPDSNKACRPFTKNRDGFIMGEGAGTIILESERCANERNADILCSLEGFSMFSEASNLTAPMANGEGMRIVMDMAMKKAGMSVDDIDYINAHGTSTMINDKYETFAIKKLFGEKAYSIPVSSVKSSIGHTLAAASVLEAIASIKAICTGIIPPTVNYDEPDPDLDLDYVPNFSRKQEIKTVLSNSFGFGGQNVTLIFKKY